MNVDVPARFDANEAVFDQIHTTNAMQTTQLVEHGKQLQRIRPN